MSPSHITRHCPGAPDRSAPYVRFLAPSHPPAINFTCATHEKSEQGVALSSRSTPHSRRLCSVDHFRFSLSLKSLTDAEFQSRSLVGYFSASFLLNR